MPTILPHINAGSDVRAISFSLNALILIGVGLLLLLIGYVAPVPPRKENAK